MEYELSLLMGATGLVLAVAVVQVVVLVRLTNTAADITRMHDRLTRMVAALDLLTDTAETGFRQFARHLEQRTAAASSEAASARRVEASARHRAPSPARGTSAATAASAPERPVRRGAVRPATPSAPAVTSRADSRPTTMASAAVPAASAPVSTLMVATRKATRTAPASTRPATATVAAFREAN